jgi:hypothetical protein
VQYVTAVVLPADDHGASAPPVGCSQMRCLLYDIDFSAAWLKVEVAYMSNTSSPQAFIHACCHHAAPRFLMLPDNTAGLMAHGGYWKHVARPWDAMQGITIYCMYYQNQPMHLSGPCMAQAHK